MATRIWVMIGIVVLVALPALWLILQTAGHGSG